MAECIKCRSFNFCPWAIPPEIICSQFQPTTQTNADRIRAMSDEELAFELAVSGCPKPHFVKDNEFVDCPAEREPSKADCVACWLDWLRQEAEDGQTP